MRVSRNNTGIHTEGTELQPASVLAYVESLDSTNKAVNGTWNELDAARAERDRVLYGNESGLTEIVKNVKSYVHSVFGIKSSEYQRISGIKFVKKFNKEKGIE